MESKYPKLFPVPRHAEAFRPCGHCGNDVNSHPNDECIWQTPAEALEHLEALIESMCSYGGSER